MNGLHVFAIDPLPEIHGGDDLAGLIASTAPALLDGDIVVVSSKVVAKAEGRVVAGVGRQDAVDEETKRVVARRGNLRIVETRHGLVLAAAGVDASNVPAGSVVLLPVDPDASSRRLRAALYASLGIRLAVVVTDTAGRPWRIGQTDIAIGTAGIEPLLDLRGTRDTFGNMLDVTMPAVADEVAAAAELVMGKTAATPVAVVRGLGHLVQVSDGPGATALVRSPAEDLFAVGSHDVVRSRRTVRAFASQPVDRLVIESAVADAITAPAPHQCTPWRFIMVSDDRRADLLKAMEHQWRVDLRADGLDDATIDRRVARGAILHEAPSLVVPCLVGDGAHEYPDPTRSRAEHEMFVLSVGAGIENFLISLAVRGVGSAWISSTLFCPQVVREVLDLDAGWRPMGSVAIGIPAEPPAGRPERDPALFLLDR